MRTCALICTQACNMQLHYSRICCSRELINAFEPVRSGIFTAPCGDVCLNMDSGLIEEKTFCSHCVCVCSQGGKTGAVQKCSTCRGRGMRIMIRQLAPGMVQQMQSVCTDCNGEGKCSGGTKSQTGRRFLVCLAVTAKLGMGSGCAI